MATITHINNNLETLATAMQQLVAMGYFDSVEYDSTSKAVVCYDADENAVLTLATTGIVLNATLRFDDGRTITVGFGNGQTGYYGCPYYLYVCSGGAYLSIIPSGGAVTTQNTIYTGLIISKTNRGKIGIMGLVSATNNIAARYDGLRSFATDDDEVQTATMFTFGQPTLRNQTELVEIPTCAAPNAVSYFPDVYYTLTSQYPYTNNVATPPQNFTQDGKRYLWVGYYAIRDEEES